MDMLPQTPLTLWDVVVYSTRLYKRALPKVIILAFLAALLVILPVNFIFTSTGSFFHTLMGWERWLAYSPFIILTVIVQLSVIYSLHCIAIHSSMPAGLALINATKKSPEILLIAINYCVIVLAGTMLVVVPGIILCVSLIFSFLLCITENLSISKCITVSHRLVWGNWLRTFALFLFVITLTFTVSLLFVTLCVAIINLFALSLNVSQWIFSFGQMIAHALMLPYIFSFGLIMLEDLKLRKIAKTADL